MVDYFPLRSNSHKFPEPDPEPEDEEQAGQQQVVVDFVYNAHEIEGKSKTVALKLLLQLPLQ